MQKRITTLLLSSLLLPTHWAMARETVLSTQIDTGIDYSDRSYDDEQLPTVVPDPASRDDNRSSIVIAPKINLFSESTSDSAMISYKPSLRYDLMESKSDDINHEGSLGYRRKITRDWGLKVYDLFKNTDDYESNTPTEPSRDNIFIDELTALIPSTNSNLRDELGSRRYTRNQFSMSTDYSLGNNSRLVLGTGWDHLEYDSASTDESSYQDYDKYNLDIAVSQDINPLWSVKGYTQYLRGVYDSDGTSDDDLNEYHLGGILENRFIHRHPITLSYDFSATTYDDESIDSSQIHKMTFGYHLLTDPILDVSLGAGPTYTRLYDSEDSWDANANLNILSKIARGSLRLTSDISTQFDNFSGTEDRSLTDYWQTRAEFSYPIYHSLETALYCGYKDESREEVGSDSVIDVASLSAGTVLKYRISNNYDVGLNYDYTIQDSDRAEDSYYEHRVQLMFSYRTDLFTW